MTKRGVLKFRKDTKAAMPCTRNTITAFAYKDFGKECEA
jgi:hypothetical protein